jgi:hypothetical protein
MKEMRATFAIARRRMSRRFALAWGARLAIAAAAGALLAGTPQAGAVATALAVAAAPLGATRGIRELTFFAMPLYGRQLARAQAIAPCVAAFAVPAGFALGAVLTGRPFTPGTGVAAYLAGAVTALVAMSAALRDGARAWLYLILAWACGALVAGAALLAGTTGRTAQLALAVTLGFLALRQFGETLARYDPIPAPRER